MTTWEAGAERSPSVPFEEFSRLMRALSEHAVEYVLVGGIAVNLHGLVRATEDIDLFVRPEPSNIGRLKRALDQVWNDPCLEEIREEDLMGEYPVVRYGPPEGEFLVDLIGRLGTEVGYDDLGWEILEVEGIPIRVATPVTLYRMKRDTVRPQDRVDAAVLAEKFGLQEG